MANFNIELNFETIEEAVEYRDLYLKTFPAHAEAINEAYTECVERIYFQSFKWDFSKCSTLDEVKAEWKRAAMVNHPDRGGSTKRMQRLNNEFDQVKKQVKKYY